MIAVRRFITADDADLLDGTDLDNVPIDTQMFIYGASTQIDTTMTLTVPGIQAPLNANPLVIRAGPELRQNEDLITSFIVAQNGHVVIAMDIVTAATAVILIIAPNA